MHNLKFLELFLIQPVLFLNSFFLDVQINKVDPVMDERKLRLSGKHISEQILRYYRYFFTYAEAQHWFIHFCTNILMFVTPKYKNSIIYNIMLDTQAKIHCFCNIFVICHHMKSSDFSLNLSSTLLSTLSEDFSVNKGRLSRFEDNKHLKILSQALFNVF